MSCRIGSKMKKNRRAGALAAPRLAYFLGLISFPETQAAALSR